MNNDALDDFLPCDVCPDRHDCPGACALVMTFWNLISRAIECEYERSGVIYDTM